MVSCTFAYLVTKAELLGGHKHTSLAQAAALYLTELHKRNRRACRWLKNFIIGFTFKCNEVILYAASCYWLFSVTNSMYSNGDCTEYRPETRFLIAQISTILVTLFA